MMACTGRDRSPIFKLMKYKIVLFDEVYILFHFNIILKHNGMSSTKIRGKRLVSGVMVTWDDNIKMGFF